MSERPSSLSVGVCALIALYSDPNSPLNDLLSSASAAAAAAAGGGVSLNANSNGHKDADGDETSATATTKIASFIEASVIGSSAAGRSSSSSSSSSASSSSALSNWLHDLYYIDRTAITTTAANTTTNAAATGKVGEDAAYLLLETLQLAAESVDSLMDLMDSLKGAVRHEGLVDADSFNGIYMRQICLGFDELSFESVTLLWQVFQRDVTNCSLPDDDDDGDDVGGNNISHNNNTLAGDWPPSTEQLHEMIRRDCVEFHHDFAPSTGRTQLRQRSSYEAMEMYIRDMLQKEPELPVAYFLRYLNCLRHGERVGALDALHQYFDHAMVQHAPMTMTTTRRTGGGVGSTSPISSDILQFSAILLAMTHSTFGDSDLALMATEEAVRVAQQSKDTACVAFALGWLYEHHGQDPLQRRQLLERCATRASSAGISAAAANTKPGQPHLQHLHQQHQMSQAAQANAVRAQQLRPLVSGAHLTLARHDLLDGGDLAQNATSSSDTGMDGDYNPRTSAYARAWSNLLEVTSEPSAETGIVDRPTHLTPHPSDTRSSLARQQLISAAIWDAVGMPGLSSCATKSILSTLPNDLSYDDMVIAIGNISRLAFYGSPSAIRSQPIKVTTQIASQDSGTRGMAGKSNNRRRPTTCIYSTAVSTLIDLRRELGMDGNELEETILHSLALTLHEWAVNRMDVDDAAALQKALQSYLHPGLANYDQLCADIKMQQCMYHCHLRNWDAAKATARKGLEICEKSGFVNQRARFLIQTSIIHLESNRTQCTSALPPLLEAVTLCEERDIHSLHALGISVLAQVFLRMCNPKRAISLLDASIPTLLQREHVWYQAEAYRTLGKAHMNIAVNAMKQSNDKNESERTPTATATMDNSNNMATEDNEDVQKPTDSTLPVVSEKRYRKALQALKKSERLYESCQDCIRLQENLYLQSQIYNLLGEETRREATAERFLQIGKHLGDDGDDDDEEEEEKKKSVNGYTISTTTILDALNDPLQLEALTKRVIL